MLCWSGLIGMGKHEVKKKEEKIYLNIWLKEGLKEGSEDLPSPFLYMSFKQNILIIH